MTNDINPTCYKQTKVVRVPECYWWQFCGGCGHCWSCLSRPKYSLHQDNTIWASAAASFSLLTLLAVASFILHYRNFQAYVKASLKWLNDVRQLAFQSPSNLEIKSY